MWLPHLVLYNSISTETSMWDAGAAWVRSSGFVHWSRPGTIDVTCRYSGLVAFPRDTLSCPIEIASWSTSDLITNLTFFDDYDNRTDPGKLARGDKGCAEISVQSAATGVSYQEYNLEATSCFKHTRSYPCCPDESWTQLWIVIHLKRAGSNFYFRLIVFPGIALTILCFLSFFLDVSATGERLGLCSTMILANFVLMTLVAEKLPTCAEWLWIDLLNLVNLTFCIIALVQSIYVTYVCFEGAEAVREALAEKLDYYSRCTIPTVYVVLLGVIYSFTPNDFYAANPAEDFAKPMQAGLHWNLEGGGFDVGVAIAAPLIMASLAVLRIYAKKKCPSQVVDAGSTKPAPQGTLRRNLTRIVAAHNLRRMRRMGRVNSPAKTAQAATC